MLLALAPAGLAPAADPALPDLRALTAGDWAARIHLVVSNPGHPNLGAGFEGLYDDHWDRTLVLSLRPGASPAAGTAWLLHEDKDAARLKPTQYAAWKGVYAFARSPDEPDVLRLTLGFTRKYAGRAGSTGVAWGLSERYVPKGAELDIPLDWDRVDADPLVLSITRAFHVDGRGKETVRRDDPATFRERLAGRGEVIPVRSVEFLTGGQVLKL